MEWWLQLLIMFGVLVVIIFLGMPVPFAVCFAAMLAIILWWGSEGLYIFALTASGQLSNYLLVSIPLFVLMAEVMVFSGMTEDAFTAAQKWLSRVPGGLAVAAEILAILAAAAIGTSAASAAVVGGACIPEMRRRGYDTGLACGACAAGGALGILIPPSLYFIAYGILTEVSVGHLFIGGILPGLLLAGMFIIAIIVRCARNPSLGPPVSGVTWGERFGSTWRIWAILTLVVFILAAIYLGIAAVSEVAGIGAFVALVIAVVYRRLNWAKMQNALMRTLRITCMMAWILIGAFALSHVMARLDIPNQLLAAIVNSGMPRWGVMALINVALILLGCVLDTGCILMLTVPLLVPVIRGLGFDPLWFGVVFVMNMEMGVITPPFGLNLFIIKGVVPDVSMRDIIKGSLPFIPLQALGLAIVMIFPQIATWLPAHM